MDLCRFGAGGLDAWFESTLSRLFRLGVNCTEGDPDGSVMFKVLPVFAMLVRPILSANESLFVVGLACSALTSVEDLETSSIGFFFLFRFRLLGFFRVDAS